MDRLTILGILGGAILIAGVGLAQEFAGLPLKLVSGQNNMLTATEGKLTWELAPQGPHETLDLRVFGVNGNSLRGQSDFPLYFTLATHVLMIKSRDGHLFP